MNWNQAFKAMEAGAAPVSTTLPPMMSARDLQTTEFPPVSWIVRPLRKLIWRRMSSLAIDPEAIKAKDFDPSLFTANSADIDNEWWPLPPGSPCRVPVCRSLPRLGSSRR